jgi:APA family basic amino acid/polyamine antiporter
MKTPARDLPRGLLIGVAGVILAYLTVTHVCLRGLGVSSLAATKTPASDVMRLALGEKGARLIALGIVVSTAGFLSQGMLTAPRVYYQMAKDGVFFKAVGWVHPKSQAPVMAIALQGGCAAVIAACVEYGDILNFVVGVDQLFFGLTGAALLIFRMREKRGEVTQKVLMHVPGHPITTSLFVLACLGLSIVTIAQYYRSAGIGAAILVAGLIVFPFWRRRGVDGRTNTA